MFSIVDLGVLLFLLVATFLIFIRPIFSAFFHVHLSTLHILSNFLPCWLLFSGKPHRLTLIIYSGFLNLWATENFLAGHSQVLLKLSRFCKLNHLTKTYVADGLHTTQYALVCRYALEIIATRKFPRSLPRCAQYASSEGILRHTRGSCCHENEV